MFVRRSLGVAYVEVNGMLSEQLTLPDLCRSLHHAETAAHLFKQKQGCNLQKNTPVHNPLLFF